MKILLYRTPQCFPEKDGYNNCTMVADHLGKMLSEPLKCSSDYVDIKILANEIVSTQIEKYSNLSMDITPITNSDLLYIYGTIEPNKILNSDDIYEEYSDDIVSKFKNVLYKKYGNWEPDIIIVYTSGRKVFEKLYPNALILSAENAIFSRPPFPRTLQYDCFGMIQNFLNKFSFDINNYKISDEINEKVNIFKTNIINLIEENNPIKDRILYYKTKFDKLVLVPLVCLDDSYIGETIYNSDFSYLLDVMSKIPSNIGVVVTQHDGEKGLLNNVLLDYFREKFPNLIFFEKENNIAYGSSSQLFFNYVDAIIVNRTITGIHSLLWDKKIITTCKQYNNWFADKNNFDDLLTFLSQPTKNKNNIIYWYLTHYAIFEKNFNKSNWYYNYFKLKLEKYRKSGITFDFYEQIEDFDELSTYIINYVDNIYNPKPIIKTYKKPTLLQTIFSVRNEDSHKVLRLFGLKFKFRRKNH